MNQLWPGGRSVAVMVNVAYEAWPEGVAPGISPMGNPLPSGLLDTQAISWADYGPKAGLARLLGVLERSGTRATFMVSGILTDKYPETIKGIVEQGHEICGHSWSQNVLPVALSESEERHEMLRCIEALASVSGQRPQGWISPRGTPSRHTARLAREAGLSWFGDVFDSDLPYMLDTEAGPIVALPLQMEINDLPLIMRFGRSPLALHEELSRLLHYALRSGELSLLDITVHVHVGGRPAVAGVFEDSLSELRERGDVWLTTRNAVAAHVWDSPLSA